RLLVQDAYRGLIPAPARRAVRRLKGRGDGTEFDLVPYVDAGASWTSIYGALRDVTALDRRGFYHLNWETHRLVNVPDLMWRERQSDQGAGIERRSPFHDLRVIELLATVPERMKRH